MEAEKELKRLAEDEEKKTEARKRAGFVDAVAPAPCRMLWPRIIDTPSQPCTAPHIWHNLALR